LSVIWGYLFGGYNYTEVENTEASTAISEFLSSIWLRPMMEIMLLIYYFCYYIILGTKILNKTENYIYFVNIYFLVSVASLFVGLGDLILVNVFGKGILARQFSEYLTSSQVLIGNRFHGFSGEPRDAFVQIILMFSVMFLFKLSIGGKEIKIHKIFIFISFMALVLTQSVSGLMLVPIFMLLMPIYYLPKYLSIKSLALLCVLLVISLFIALYAFNYSERVMYYADTYSDIFKQLKTGLYKLSFDQLTQIVNIYPLFKLSEYLIGDEKLRFFIGSGMSSSAYVNTDLMFGGLSFPQAAITRIMYELGIFGFFIYCSFFLSMIKAKKTLINKYYYNNIKTIHIIFIVMLSSSLAHKSSNIWLFSLFAIVTSMLSTEKIGAIKSALSSRHHIKTILGMQ